MCPAGPNASPTILNQNGLAMLLPYLEQENVYRLFNWDETFAMLTAPTYDRTGMPYVGNPTTNGNAAASTRVLKIFLCPSDTQKPDGWMSGIAYGPDGSSAGTATSYDFVTSDNDFLACNNWSKGAATLRRMFGENSTTKPADVQDGLSNTFAMGETTLRHANGRAFAWAYRSWVCSGIDPGTHDPGINHWHLPHVDPTWQSPPYNPKIGVLRTWWAAAGSLHPRGCHFIFGDGAVRFVSEDINTTTLEWFCAMSDGNVVDPTNLQ
jgi:hypothetical protein